MESLFARRAVIVLLMADLPPLNEATSGERIPGSQKQGRARDAKRETGAGSEIIVSLLDDVLVAFDNCSHVRLRGITLEATRTSGVFMTRGEDNVLERPRLAVDVPFSRVVGAVAGRGQPFGQEFRPGGPRAGGAPLPIGQGGAMNRLGIVAREQRRPRGPAPRGVVALREAHSPGGQAVEVRRVDLAAMRAQVGKPEVIGEDDDDIRSARSRIGCQSRRRHACADDRKSPATHRPISAITSA